MITQPPRRYTKLAFAIMVAALVIGAAIYASPYIGRSSASTTTSTGAPVQIITPKTASATISTDGLQMSASINASNIAVGQSVNVNLSLFNTLPSVNTIPPSSDWPFQGVGVNLWGACVGVYPLEVAILNGNYTAQELPTVANSTFPYTCAGFIQVDSIVFQPNSDQANVTGTGPGPGVNQTLGPDHLALDFTTSGYWDLENLLKESNPPIIGARPPSAIAFVPGTYTVAVEDEWGDVVLLYFTVTDSSTTSSQSNNTISVSGLSLCATNCLYPAPYLSGTLYIKGSTPFVGDEVYVNGTLDGSVPQSSRTNTVVTCVSSSGESLAICSTQSGVSYTLTDFSLFYKGGLPSKFLPAVVGDTYVITFVAIFEDGSNATTTMVVTAY